MGPLIVVPHHELRRAILIKALLRERERERQRDIERNLFLHSIRNSIFLLSGELQSRHCLSTSNGSDFCISII
jgi:hypothetical protein